MGVCALFTEGQNRKRPSTGLGDTGQAKAKDMQEGHGGGQRGVVNTEGISGQGQTQVPKSAPCSGLSPASSCLGSLCWDLGSWAVGDGVTYARLGNNSSGGSISVQGNWGHGKEDPFQEWRSFWWEGGFAPLSPKFPVSV